MAELRQRLPSAVPVPEVPRGLVFGEFFAGKGVRTPAVHAAGLDVMEPQDVATGGADFASPEDLVRVRHRLSQASRGRRLALHFAPPCSTFSVARNRSLATKVRSNTQPEGMLGPDGRRPQEVAVANEIARATAELALWSHTSLGAFVSIENPEGSYLWKLPCFNPLFQEGWSFVKLHACMYGAEFRKPTALLCSPGWAPALSARCEWRPADARYTCGHTGEDGPRPHLRLGGDGGADVRRCGVHAGLGRGLGARARRLGPEGRCERGWT